MTHHGPGVVEESTVVLIQGWGKALVCAVLWVSVGGGATEAGWVIEGMLNHCVKPFIAAGPFRIFISS